MDRVEIKREVSQSQIEASIAGFIKEKIPRFNREALDSGNNLAEVFGGNGIDIVIGGEGVARHVQDTYGIPLDQREDYFPEEQSIKDVAGIIYNSIHTGRKLS